MKTILVIGATGQIGQRVCQSLVNDGHSVRAIARDSQRASELEHLDLEIFTVDLENDFCDAYEGVQKVIFVAGSGSSSGYDKTILVDLWAAKRAIDYAEEEPSVEHFILLSSFGADDPDEINSSIKPYLITKHITDEYLTKASVPYTVLRPGKLTNTPATGGFTSERPNIGADTSISRTDVADAICYCVEHDSTKIRVVELFTGHETIDRMFG
ncbi:SDR family oxidoreductase [Marinomonas atlantica]|uniref:SDR family oxidoreductase n=1 Tax=Marinomonas atlantica TaxID=1806668 RepID=UPI000829F493|nr:SDR family oxidoreductase [Marinomonas atlantica]